MNCMYNNPNEQFLSRLLPIAVPTIFDCSTFMGLNDYECLSNFELFEIPLLEKMLMMKNGESFRR